MAGDLGRQSFWLDPNNTLDFVEIDVPAIDLAQVLGTHVYGIIGIHEGDVLLQIEVESLEIQRLLGKLDRGEGKDIG
jgi:hypothetical protein